MKAILLVVALAAICTANPVKLRREDVTEDLLNDPRFLVYETEDGLFEVEDLYNTTAAGEVFATEDDISFYFFTPSNRNTGVKIKESQLRDIVRLTGFDIHRETLVVIHGWKNDFTSPVNDEIKTAALRNKNINVIVVDWSKISQKLYVVAQGAVLRVGNYIGDFLLKLDDVLRHRIHKLTIVGHSLGAHISGNAGARTGGLIETIIGLDPAGPLFSESNINNRLDPSDARYVQVIHTNDGRLGWGIKMGHADYFPNGGRSQPGCGFDATGSCAHSRAYVYFSESLNNNAFLSYSCTSYSDYTNGRCRSNTQSYLGNFPIFRSIEGFYYLTTNSNSPYARG